MSNILYISIYYYLLFRKLRESTRNDVGVYFLYILLSEQFRLEGIKIMKNKPTRIYFRPHKLKRGHKLIELSHDATHSDCFKWIRENMTFRYG